MTGKTIIYTALLTALLLAGCAAPPRQELEGARKAVAQAYAKQAFQLAPGEYRSASEALHEGEQLVHTGDYERAREALSFAESQARRAELKAREEQIRLEEEQRRIHQARLEAERKLRESRKAAQSPPEIVKPAPPPPPPEPPPEPTPAPPEPPEPLTRYTVDNGETLWTIAANREVYRDALLWPLIYKANRDQIKDPRQIYPGQVLNIPRELTRDEKEEARQTARESDIFPLQLLIGNRSGEPE